MTALAMPPGRLLHAAEKLGRLEPAGTGSARLVSVAARVIEVAERVIELFGLKAQRGGQIERRLGRRRRLPAGRGLAEKSLRRLTRGPHRLQQALDVRPARAPVAHQREREELAGQIREIEGSGQIAQLGQPHPGIVRPLSGHQAHRDSRLTQQGGHQLRVVPVEVHQHQTA